jgi:glutathione synthase/RimK-type ligase-like ATP-grasp enzyme
MRNYIAVVTCESLGDYNNNAESEDLMLAELLKEHGISYEFQVWSDPNVEWSKYSHLLIKSPWDYFDRYTEFKDWCSRIKHMGIPVFNDVETILWNSDKKYLQEIQDKGHKIIPTQFLPKDQEVALETAFADFQTDLLIFKPSVSGGAKNTIKLKQGETASYETLVNDLVKEEEFLLQPFIPEVVAEGEYSLIFFNGKFSHAVLKSPKDGDFRVQHFFGGKITTIEPSEKMMEDSQNIINDFAQNCLYARVDGVLIDGEFYLMELELIEPYLFLFTSPEAKRNYMEALNAKLSIDNK